ncbi:hypothetical protein MYX76_12265 [Desulfobacterota bacterium AH_259_B03_O07]|nr:hypothetical protein [Desulfobacterota bacterium AH_259_B03_O07]
MAGYENLVLTDNVRRAVLRVNSDTGDRTLLSQQEWWIENIALESILTFKTYKNAIEMPDHWLTTN